jgi:hypothetical protein
MAPTTPQSHSQELINVKLLLIGNSSVGKSSLLLRFSDKQWLPEDEASATIGVDFRVCVVCTVHFFSLEKKLTMMSSLSFVVLVDARLRTGLVFFFLSAWGDAIHYRYTRWRSTGGKSR